MAESLLRMFRGALRKKATKCSTCARTATGRTSFSLRKSATDVKSIKAIILIVLTYSCRIVSTSLASTCPCSPEDMISRSCL